MSANKPKPQQSGQKPNKEDEFNKGPQDRDQSGQQGGQQRGRDTQDTPINQRGQGSERGGR